MLKVYKCETVFEDDKGDIRIVGYSGFRLMEEKEAQNKKEILT